MLSVEIREKLNSKKEPHVKIVMENDEKQPHVKRAVEMGEFVSVCKLYLELWNKKESVLLVEEVEKKSPRNVIPAMEKNIKKHL